MPSKRYLSVGCCLLLLLAAPLTVLARVKLITLPVRERVEIQLDHPHLTLIEEERVVPLVQGVNQVDFSWANTMIDPDTIVFRVLAPAAGAELDIEVLAVSYPPNENALVWSVSASSAGAARVRISYVINGLDKNFHYRAIAANDESALTLSQFARIKNSANEAFDDSFIWTGWGERIEKPIGLHESKDILLNKFINVPIRKTYTADPLEFGYLDRSQDKLNVPMHYVIENAAASGLGQASLPFGKARIFQDDGRGSTAFIGEDWAKFTPPDDELRLYLGLARDIVVKRTINRNERRRIKGNLYDYEVEVSYEIENFKDSPATLRLVENLQQLRTEVIGGQQRDPQFEILPATTLVGPDREESDYQRLVFSAELPPRSADGQAVKQSHRLRLVFKNEW